jgi:hypothetical protein
MGRSLADLAALATDPDLNPIERMCHCATLTNRSHAATADLARTCDVRVEESLEGLGNALAMYAEDVGRLVGSDRTVRASAERRWALLLVAAVAASDADLIAQTSPERTTPTTNHDHNPMQLPGAVIQTRTRPGGAGRAPLPATQDPAQLPSSYVAISS